MTQQLQAWLSEERGRRAYVEYLGTSLYGGYRCVLLVPSGEHREGKAVADFVEHSLEGAIRYALSHVGGIR